MAGILGSLHNVLKMLVSIKPRDFISFSMFFPFMIIIYMITSSIMNRSISGLIYIFGLFLTLFNNMLVSSLQKGNLSQSERIKSELCYVGLPLVSSNNINSSPNMAVITYTFFYMIAPAILQNLFFIRNPLGFIEYLVTNNIGLIGFFIMVGGLNVVAEDKMGCSDPKLRGMDHFNGFIIGLFSAWLYIFAYYVSGNKNILIKNQFLSNKIICDTPKNVLFRCDNKGEKTNTITFSQRDSPEHPDNEKYEGGHPDLAMLSTIKNPDWEYIHLQGKTGIIVFKKENYQGENAKYTYDDLYKIADDKGREPSNSGYITIKKNEILQNIRSIQLLKQ